MTAADSPRARRTRRPPPARGAALLIAMVLLTVVATLSAGMVWQQWRAVEVEAAERARVQNQWLLGGALDWARLILRAGARPGTTTSLSDAWATPLQDARLSSFLAQDKDNNADSGPEAFLSGQIRDAQARYNLRNLVVDGKVDPRQVAILQRLCIGAGLGPDVAGAVAGGLLSSASADRDAPLPPQHWADLAWLGLDAAVLERLETVAVLLPVATPLNLNTASREVLAGVVAGLDLGSADRLVQARAAKALGSLAAAAEVLGAGIPLNERDVDVKSSFFEVDGRLRVEQRALQARHLVERRSGQQVVAIARSRAVVRLPDLQPQR